jgi:hypothetical protein
MSTMMIALLAAFTPGDGCCAPKKTSDASCCATTVTTVGKHYERQMVCKHATPGKVQVEVKPEDRQPGDVEGIKTVGKHTEKAWYRWVDARKAVDTDCAKAASKDSCPTGYFTLGKRLHLRSYCERGGERVLCGDKAGECDACLN